MEDLSRFGGVGTEGLVTGADLGVTDPAVCAGLGLCCSAVVGFPFLCSCLSETIRSKVLVKVVMSSSCVLLT